MKERDKEKSRGIGRRKRDLEGRGGKRNSRWEERRGKEGGISRGLQVLREKGAGRGKLTCSEDQESGCRSLREATVVESKKKRETNRGKQ